MHNTALQPLQQYLSVKSKQLCDQAFELMAVSKDPYHDQTHVDRMLKDFSFLLQTEKSVAVKLNPEVVILSICWHDSWKAGRVGKSTLQLLFHQLWDGLGSKSLFDKAAQKVKLDEQLRRDVGYAIRKHAHFQFLPITTLEAKILRDLDDLDLWSEERFERGKGIFAFASEWRVKIFRRTIIQQKLTTDWAIREREKRSRQFLDVLDRFLIK